MKADTKPGNYYVTAIRDNGDVAFLAGPFTNDHQAALDALPATKSKAMDLDPRAPWYSYGTSRVPLDVNPPTGKISHGTMEAA